MKPGALPLLTSHKIGSRIEIAAACPAALALGLVPGMAVTYARSLVPDLDIRDADADADAAFLSRLALFAALRWTPRACVSGTDGLFLDLTGVSHLFGGERRMCERIVRYCSRLGYQTRIAVAGTAGAAHALARFSQQAILLCPPGGEADMLAPLPVSALRLEDGDLAAARRLGIETIGALLTLPRAPLGRRFGRALLDRLDQALGRMSEPLEPVVPQDAPCATLSLLEPIMTAEAIAQVLADLMPRLMKRLEERGLGLRLLQLTCDRVDGEDQRIVIGTARATREGRHLLRLLSMKIDRIEPGFGIEAMHLVAMRTEPLAAQAIESEIGRGDAAPDIAELMDMLAGRIGARHLYRLSAVESDVPERSVSQVNPLSVAQEWPSWPRPVRLLKRPEPLDKVVALLPDGAPKRFVWRGRSHNVRRADGPERVYGEWWRRISEAEAVRDYFRVENDRGERFWLFRKGDGLDDRTGDLSWWMQGLFG